MTASAPQPAPLSAQAQHMQECPRHMLTAKQSRSKHCFALGIVLGVTHQLPGFWTGGAVAPVWKVGVYGNVVACGLGVGIQGLRSQPHGEKMLILASEDCGLRDLRDPCGCACETWLFGLVA